MGQHSPYADRVLPWTNPQFSQGAPAEKQESNVPGKSLRILAFNFDLKTAAVAGNRFVGYEINIVNIGTVIEVLTPALPEKTPDGSNLYGVCGIIGGTALIGSSRTIILPLQDFLIPNGSKWEAIAPFKQAGDTFPVFKLAYEFV